MKAKSPDRSAAPCLEILPAQGQELERVGQDEGNHQARREEHEAPMPGHFSPSGPADSGKGEEHQRRHIQGSPSPIGKFRVHGASIAPAPTRAH